MDASGPKLSFSLKKGRKRKRGVLLNDDDAEAANNQAPKAVSIKRLNASTLVEAQRQQTESKKLVIPLLQKNEWVGENVPPMLERVTPASVSTSDSTNGATAVPTQTTAEEESTVKPILMVNAVPGMQGMLDGEQLTHDISVRPESASLEAYEQVPVADFGKALLRGMGWAPGKAIGKTFKTVCPNYAALAPRARNLGLGAKVLTMPGEKSSTQQKVLTPADIEARAAALEQSYSNRLISGGNNNSNSSSNSSSSSSSSSQVVDSKASNWATPGIRVRIITKKRFPNGRDYYKRKAVVSHVLSASQVVLSVEDSSTVLTVRLRDLETVMPSRKGRVRIVGLQSKYRGQMGTLLDKDSKRNKATVKVDTSKVVITLSMDDVAEFCSVQRAPRS
jgi:G patch domain/KOW motif-containing protein